MRFAILMLSVVPAFAQPAIPNVWDTQKLATFELPSPFPAVEYKPLSPEVYYRIPAFTIYKVYPVYAPGNEPQGYWEHLHQVEPQVAFDSSRLKTAADWIAAGEAVFDSPTIFTPGSIETRPEDVRNPEWYRRLKVPVAKDGTVPAYAYVVREKGKVELGTFSCAHCHTRVMPDGTTLKGGQSNFPLDAGIADSMRQFSKSLPPNSPQSPAEILRTRLEFRFYAVPWLGDRDPYRRVPTTVEEIAAIHDAVIPGLMSRQRATPFSPPRIPDLFDLRERKFLDATGLNRHREIGDLMRYAVFNQGDVQLIDYNGMFPVAKRPPPEKMFPRYTDEALYALAMYIYSLKCPPSPHKIDALSASGERVFKKAGCAGCHPAPLYTNNELMKAKAIGTDPELTNETRRGTGYYKVPSLRHAWARGPFEHNGSVATLEDWFDANRLHDDYVPTGFVGFGRRTRAVKGHLFGLDLKADEKKALIAFLMTIN